MVDEMKYIKILMMILQSSHKVSRPVDVGMFENEICDPNGTLMGKLTPTMKFEVLISNTPLSAKSLSKTVALAKWMTRVVQTNWVFPDQSSTVTESFRLCLDNRYLGVAWTKQPMPRNMYPLVI